MKILCLTGSIGMGKSEVARMLRVMGVPVFDADACVHALYAAGGAAVAPVGALYPDVVADGAIDRARLSRHVLGGGDALRALEAIVHPLVARERLAFLERTRATGAKVVVFDIPLLFETAGQGQCEAVMVVSAPPDVQRARVLARPGMTVEKFEAILAKQVPDADKRRQATYVIATDCGLEETRAAVARVIGELSR